MFDKFTDRARKAMQLANSEARRLRHEYLGAEHILLGLLKEGSGVAAHVLKEFGISSLPDLRAHVDKYVMAGPEPYIIGPDDKLPHHPDATRVLHAAVDEALSLGDGYVGTEHILLGLLRETDGIVSHVMADMGLKADPVRQATLTLLGRESFGTEQVPCEICGRPSSPVDRRCDSCWEVEKRLASYIETPAGRANVEKMLGPCRTDSPLSIESGQKVYLLHYDEITRPGRCQKIVAVYSHKKSAHEAVLQICATPESRRAFFDTFGHPQPEDIRLANFWVEAFDLKRGEALLDDWFQGCDGKYHPGWDYEAVLRDNEVTVEWCHQMVNGEGEVSEMPPELCGWGLSWKHGVIDIGPVEEHIAREAAAVFVRLWQLGVSASMADKLMGSYIHHLELQACVRLTFLVEPVYDGADDRYLNHLTLTREKFCTRISLGSEAMQSKIFKTLRPEADEELIATFTRRKKTTTESVTKQQ